MDKIEQIDGIIHYEVTKRVDGLGDITLGDIDVAAKRIYEEMVQPLEQENEQLKKRQQAMEALHQANKDLVRQVECYKHEVETYKSQLAAIKITHK